MLLQLERDLGNDTEHATLHVRVNLSPYTLGFKWPLAPGSRPVMRHSKVHSLH